MLVHVLLGLKVRLSTCTRLILMHHTVSNFGSHQAYAFFIIIIIIILLLLYMLEFTSKKMRDKFYKQTSEECILD